jgi:carbamate kinase
VNRALRPTVIAFGGNALVRREDHATQRLQIERSDRLAREILPMLQEGRPLALVHGNGPQVGDELIRVEEAVTKVPPLSLDMCVAATVGTIGALLERALRNAATGAGLDLDVATLVTLVRVQERDPGLVVPTKPVGPHFNRYRAEYLRETLGWSMVEAAPGAWRKIVASPRPAEVLNASLVAEAIRPGRVIIVAGGGGIPVTRCEDGRLVGVEAVVDKDYVAEMVARRVDADRLLVLTDVDQVCLDFGSPTQRPLALLNLAEAEAHLRTGQFPPGSMGPKIEAAVQFVRATGGEVLITSPESLAVALAGKTGTRVVP